MPLYKEFFHKHTHDDIKYRNLALNFKIRFKEAFGYFRDGVYTQTSKGRLRDYRTPWILLEVTPENEKLFAWVFYNFNIFTTLNYYREKRVTKECFVDLAFDFDAPELEKSWEDTRKMSEFFQSRQVSYQLYFSGKKGFHIVIGYETFGQEYEENNHLVNKEMVKLLQQETGPLPTLDMAIYSSRRQLRMKNSKHSGSGLFKVPITHEELVSGMESILKLGKKRRNNFPRIDSCYSDYLHHLYLQARQNLARLPKYDVPKVDLDVLEGKYPPCIQECLKVGIKPEARVNRNETTMLLATFFKSQGRDIQETKDLLTDHAVTTLKRFSSSSDREIVGSTKSCITTIYRSGAYKFNCHLARGKYKLRCDDTCKLYRKYRDSHNSRKLVYIEVEQPEPQPTYTVEEIRTGIGEQIDNYLADPQGRILLIKVPPGVGKTVTTLRHLSLGNGRVFWVAGRKDMFDNIPVDHLFFWKRILGRHKGIYDKHGNLIEEANCKHAELAHILGDKNHNIGRRLCRKHCDVGIANCDYFRQFQDRERHWFVQQPFFFYTKDNFVDPFDVVVIDEDILEGFKKETRITLEDVRQNYQLFKETRDELESNKKLVRDFYALFGKEPPDEAHINENLDPTIELLYIIGMVAKSDIPFAAFETGKLILEKIERISKEKLGKDIRDILQSITDPNVFDKEIEFDLKDESGIPLNFFKYLYEVLHYEFFKKHPDNNLSRIFFQKHPAKTDKGAVCLESLQLISKLEKHTAKPIIILDATGKKRIYEKLFDREVIEYSPQVKLENEIIQVYSALNSKRSLSNKKHLQRYIDAIKKLVARDPNTLVVCKEVFKESVIAQLPKSVQCAHFYGLRGSNEYKDFKQVIILGAPQNREEEIKKYAGILHYNDDRSVDTSVEYRYRPYMALAENARAPAAMVLEYRDPCLQDINEIYREDEIIQGLNRIRIAQDPSKRVILLTNIPLPGLPISKLVSLEELCGEVTAKRLVEDLVRLSMDKLGLTCFYDIIDPLLNKNPLMGKIQAKQVAEWLSKKFGIDSGVRPEDKVSERTLRTYFPKVVADMGLYRLKLISENKDSGRRYLDVYGYDAKNVEEALRSKWIWLEGHFRVEEYPKAQQGI